jgi:hypothetical protein
MSQSRSSNCLQRRVLRFIIDVYALYALYKKVEKNFQDILVIIISKFKHNKIIILPLYSPAQAGLIHSEFDVKCVFSNFKKVFTTHISVVSFSLNISSSF